MMYGLIRAARRLLLTTNDYIFHLNSLVIDHPLCN